MNETAIPEIRAQVVCGAANNQLATPADGPRLAARAILDAPYYLVNAGGLISVSHRPLGMSEDTARAKLAAIPETLMEIFDRADADGTSPDVAADRVAEARVAA